MSSTILAGEDGGLLKLNSLSLVQIQWETSTDYWNISNFRHWSNPLHLVDER